jgi:hypothetical protein
VAKRGAFLENEMGTIDISDRILAYFAEGIRYRFAVFSSDSFSVG